jgi:hypothetical protein
MSSCRQGLAPLGYSIFTLSHFLTENRAHFS